MALLQQQVALVVFGENLYQVVDWLPWAERFYLVSVGQPLSESGPAPDTACLPWNAGHHIRGEPPWPCQPAGLSAPHTVLLPRFPAGGVAARRLGRDVW